MSVYCLYLSHLSICLNVCICTVHCRLLAAISRLFIYIYIFLFILSPFLYINDHTLLRVHLYKNILKRLKYNEKNGIIITRKQKREQRMKNGLANPDSSRRLQKMHDKIPLQKGVQAGTCVEIKVGQHKMHAHDLYVVHFLRESVWCKKERDPTRAFCLHNVSYQSL